MGIDVTLGTNSTEALPIGGEIFSQRIGGIIVSTLFRGA